MRVRIAVLTSMVLGFGTTCGGDDPDLVDLDLAATVEEIPRLCNPTAGGGQGDLAIPISRGSAQGQDCLEDKARVKALVKFATTHCVGDFDPECTPECEECSDAEPCQRVMGLDEDLRKIPITDDDGNTCIMVDDRTCPKNAAGERKAFRCTLDTTVPGGPPPPPPHTFFCGCFCRR